MDLKQITKASEKKYVEKMYYFRDNSGRLISCDKEFTDKKRNAAINSYEINQSIKDANVIRKKGLTFDALEWKKQWIKRWNSEKELWCKTWDRNHIIEEQPLERFEKYYAPDKIGTQKYDHKKHFSRYVKVDGMERNALDFIYSDLKMINKAEKTVNQDLLCLYYAVHDFCEAGLKKDAFNIYYWVITKVLKLPYDKAKEMIEMLSNYEGNASQLTMSHRDHYSHSVFVFLTGLAIYHTSDKYREAYKSKTMEYYSMDEADLAWDFITFWSITSLFHDIGYVYELPFNQIVS